MFRAWHSLCWLAGSTWIAFASGTGCLSRETSCVDTSTCAVPHSSSGSSADGAGAGGQGAAAAGGTHAEAGESGAPGGATDSAGQGGMSSAGSCDCGAWEFCHQGSCLGCSDVSSLDFGPVEALGRAGRYPRPTEQGELFYVQEKKIWYASATVAAKGELLTQAPGIEQTEPVFRVGLDSVLPAGSNFLLYQTEWNGNIATPRPKVALWSAEPPSLTSVADPPAIFASNTGYNFSIAASAQTNRAWWKRTGFDSVRGLLTAPLDGAPSDVEAISVEVSVGSSTCAMDEYIPTAWVTEDGALLLFRQLGFDEACAHPLNAHMQIYAVPIDAATGEPTGSALALDVPNGARANVSDPAFGPDCALYFSSDRGGSDQLYRAPRE
jgi:hypothetical protein